MSRADRLRALVERKIAEKRVECELTDTVSLLESGLFDSLDLLELATWIEQEISPGVDLSTTDIASEWNTVADILRFIERHSDRSAAGS